MFKQYVCSTEAQDRKLMDAVMKSIGRPFTSMIGIMGGKTQDYNDLNYVSVL